MMSVFQSDQSTLLGYNQHVRKYVCQTHIIKSFYGEEEIMYLFVLNSKGQQIGVQFIY